jgi:hypothetical protein
LQVLKPAIAYDKKMPYPARYKIGIGRSLSIQGRPAAFETGLAPAPSGTFRTYSDLKQVPSKGGKKI